MLQKVKVFALLVAITGITMLCAGSAWSDIPPPPANQQFGTDDGIFNNLVESDCRSCHDSTDHICSTSNVDRHHLMYGNSIQAGECSVNSNSCLSDEACDSLICSSSGDPCTDDVDCSLFALGETCGEVCLGETSAPVVDANQDGIDDAAYGCLNCHGVDNSTGIIQFVLERNCLQCHTQVPGEGSVHHLTATAQGLDSPIGLPDVGDCTPCHGSLVDDIGDGHMIPFYAPSLVTPSPTGGEGLPLNSMGNGAGACNYCHDSGTDNATGIQVFSNTDTHHNTGVFLSETGVANNDACLWCHNITQPEEYNIRTCEGCHGYASLHNIAVDSDTGCLLDPTDPTCEVIIGGESPGYSHVGNDSDCFGCHGFAMSSALGSGPATPFISNSDVVVITAGKDTAVTLTGAAFTNLISTYQWLSEVVLIAEDGTSLLLAPDSITQGTLTVTIPGTLAPGNYRLQAVKGDYAASNPVVISIKPDVVITSVSYDSSDGVIRIIGSGFSEAPPEGAEEYINVVVDDTPVTASSWTDTQITAPVTGYEGSVYVSSLFCSASFTGSSCDVCRADIDNNGNVGLADLGIMKTEFGLFGCDIDPCQADLDGNGSVGLSDMGIMKNEFGKTGCCI